MDASEESPIRTRHREQRDDYETLVNGVINRCSLFSDVVRKNMREVGKYLSREHRDNQSEKPEHDGGMIKGTREKLLQRFQKDVLDFSEFRKRFEMFLSNRNTTKTSFSLDNLIQPLLQQFGKHLSRHEIRFLGRKGVKVFCSPEEVSLCLTAILENACESHMGREGTILVETHDHGESVEITVIDRGCGIPFKYMAMVGRPFFSTKRGHDGLSLFFARLLLERNDGLMRIERGDETGTRVTIRLPASRKTRAPEGGREA